MSKLSQSRCLTAILLIACAIAAGGCLTADRKEVIFNVKPDGSGTGKVIFYNIRSIEEEGKDVSVRDYTELVSKYLKGTKFEDFYPDYINVKKRLYEQHGELNGELTFEFLHYADVGLYRYQDKGPWMFHVGPKADFSVEHFDTSNGQIPGDQMPVAFWPEDTREFRIVSKYDQSEKTHSLLSIFNRIGTD